MGWHDLTRGSHGLHWDSLAIPTASSTTFQDEYDFVYIDNQLKEESFKAELFLQKMW